jgi:beta-mannosidase
MEDIEGRMEIYLADFEGSSLWADATGITVPQSSSAIVYRIPGERLPPGFDPAYAYFTAKLAYNGEVSRDIHRFEKPKDLNLPDPGLSFRQSKTGNGHELVVQSRNFAMNVFLQSDVPGHFSDNFFHLEPGSNKTVLFTPSEDSGSKPGFSIKSLNDIR